MEHGYLSALDVEGRTIWIVGAYGYGKFFIVRADEILTAFMELERAVTQVRGEFDLAIATHKRACRSKDDCVSGIGKAAIRAVTKCECRPSMLPCGRLRHSL